MSSKEGLDSGSARALLQEDLSSALRMQHTTICELQSENARLNSEKNEQRRQLREEIERKNAIIKRKATATHPLQCLRRGVRASLSAEVTASRQTRFGTDKPSASGKAGASTGLNTSAAGSKSASTPWRQMRRVVNALGTAVSRKKAGTNVPAISNKRSTPCTLSHSNIGFDSKHRASANSKFFAEGAALRRTRSSGLLARFASASAAPFLLRKAKKAAREDQKAPLKAQGGENSRSCSKSNDAAGQRPRNTEVQEAEATIPDASPLADFSARLMWFLLFVLLAAFFLSSLT
ncbi:hypothetical protein, conserved [Eimeria necatrix]|uniref:Uncharacterized protein n=1 Tax=Eimeria necatrix TaxID=51315 RepID=U6MS17_9EIME|nr:hypothetical protein, conserved [Eimeria necatrix]CDJ65883.1 hypothetical protein, conserved [Eimeria necatrix]